MQHIATAAVDDDGATIPRDVLRTLGASTGDIITFGTNDDGSVSLMKEPRRGLKLSIGKFAGIFSTPEKGSLAEDLALMREIRHGDELDQGDAP